MTQQTVFLQLLPILAALIAAGAYGVHLIRKASRLHAQHDAEALQFERTMISQTARRAPSPENRPAPAEQAPIPASVSKPDSPFVDSVVSKLSIAGALELVEGPLRSNNPDLRGSIVRLRGGKVVVILDSPVRTDEAQFEALLRMFDGAITPCPNGEPLFIRRFQSFLGDLINL